MAETATKQAPSTYVGTSKVVQTDYPVCWDAIDGSIWRMMLTGIQLIDNDPYVLVLLLPEIDFANVQWP